MKQQALKSFVIVAAMVCFVVSMFILGTLTGCDKKKDSKPNQTQRPIPAYRYMCGNGDIYYNWQEVVYYYRLVAPRNCILLDGRIREHGYSPCAQCWTR